MKAIVMAGGEGTRLRPITEGRPKPMAELLGKPVLWHTVELLKKNGIEDICFTLRYMPEAIIEAFGDGSELGVSIRHSVERMPLGTAGSVRACRDFIGDEDVLVISGDAVCSFDLRRLMEIHREKGAEATIAISDHPEPTAFGLVHADENGRVTGFSEKPGWEDVTTSMINTGIYILSPAAVDMIPEGREYDFGKELFPRMLREGRKLYAVEARGYWCDIGSPEAYRRCCVDIIAGRAGIDPGVPERKDGVWSDIELDGVEIVPPVYVGPGCGIEPGAKLGPGAVIAGGSKVGSGTTVRESVVNGAKVGRGCTLTGTVVGREAAIGDGTSLFEDSVIGDRAAVGRDCRVAGGVKVWPEAVIEDGARVNKNVTERAGGETAGFRDGGALEGTLGRGMTPETAFAVGAALGREGRVGLAHAGGEAARLIADAVCCGVTLAGGECCVLDCDFEAELGYACGLFTLDGAVFVRSVGEDMSLRFFEAMGIPMGNEGRRKIERALRGEAPGYSRRVGGVSGITGAGRAYISGTVEEVKRMCLGYKRMRLAVTGSGAENRALRCVLAGLGHEIGELGPDTPGFEVGTGGTGLRVTDERGRVLEGERAWALAAECAMRLGVEALAVPVWLPEAVGRLATRYGCRLLPEKGEGAALMRRQRYLRDAVLASAVIATAMGRDSSSLSRLVDGLPPFAVERRRVETPVPRARVMRELAKAREEFAAELSGGLKMSGERGSARVAPSFDGKALELVAEAESADKAKLILDELEKTAREIGGGDGPAQS